MRGRMMVGAAAAVAGLLVGVAVNASLAQDEQAPAEAQVTLENALVTSFSVSQTTGTVFARTVPGGKAGVQVSLHELAEESSYQVVASARACSQAAGANQAVVWKTQFLTGGAQEDIYQSVRVPRLRPMSDVRSIRIYGIPSSGPAEQIQCGAAQVGRGVVGA